jgi:hypothetical protein
VELFPEDAHAGDSIGRFLLARFRTAALFGRSAQEVTFSSDGKIKLIDLI